MRRWLGQAAAIGHRNPNAMALASCDTNGRPAVRMVLLKDISESQGFGLFYTHYESRKAREFTGNPRAAGVLYWPELGRQVRFEGPIRRSPGAESDHYFASRPIGSQINAWVSQQSRAIADPDELKQLVRDKYEETGAAGKPLNPDESQAAVERPPFWGGFRMWFDSIELWAEGADRLHERLHYRRELAADDNAGFEAGAWEFEWLQP